MFFHPAARRYLEESVTLALAEDGEDLTSQALFPPKAPARAIIVAKQEAIVAGLPIADVVMNAVQEGTSSGINTKVEDGSRVTSGQTVLEIEGPATVLLKAERVILNFICHLSGIATLVDAYAQKLKGTTTTLLDTRKTLPCLRYPEKYAVLMGGGKNHRMDLSEMLMLKDNHIDRAGGITPAVEALKKAYSPCPPIEVECRTTEEVKEAASLDINRIMLDNMPPAVLADTLALIPPHIETEVSGGVNMETIAQIAQAGPNFISVGRLTHSAPAADFSMRITLETE